MVRLHSLYLHFWSSGSSGSSSFTFWWKIYRNIWRAKAPRQYWINTWCIWRLNAHNKDELVWCGSISLSADTVPSRLVLVRWPAWEPGHGMRGMSDLRLSYGRTLAHTQNLTFVLGHYFGHNTLAGRWSSLRSRLLIKGSRYANASFTHPPWNGHCPTQTKWCWKEGLNYFIA